MRGCDVTSTREFWSPELKFGPEEAELMYTPSVLYDAAVLDAKAKGVTVDNYPRDILREHEETTHNETEVYSPNIN